MSEKKRVLIVSDSCTRNTGYGIVSRNIIKNLIATDKYIIGQLGLAGTPTPPQFPIYHYSQIRNHKNCCGKNNCIELHNPFTQKIEYIELDVFTKNHPDQKICSRGEPSPDDKYGYNSIYYIVNHFQPDIVIPINDIWGLYNIAHLKNRKHFKLLSYLAIDSECMFPVIKSPDKYLPNIQPNVVLESMDKTVFFLPWAKNVVNKTIKLITKTELSNTEIIPHGVDREIWKPLSNKNTLREKYFGIKPNSNVFLIGSLHRNQPRKRLDSIIQTLKIFINKYEKTSKVMCYFHCSLGDPMGWNLPWLADYYGVKDRCIFDKNIKPGQGPDDTTLNEIINCFDVHLSLTNSEGWALTILETMSAGIPNICSNYSAHAQWGKEAIIPVKIASYEHESRTGFLKANVDIEDAAKQLKLVYESKEFRNDYIQKGIKLASKLEWKDVCKKWINLIDETNITDLKPDRYIKYNIDPKNIPIKNIPENPTEQEFELLEL